MATDTGITTSGIGYTFHGKAIYGAGRYWLFYWDNSTGSGDYISSTNGTSWSSYSTWKAAATTAAAFDFWFDGTYVHYVHQTTGSPGSLYYRRGTLVSDGTITWSAAEQTAASITTTVNRPSICVDSSGYAYIGYNSTAADAGQPWVIKNANADGTWSTDGSAAQINSGGSDTTAGDSWRVGWALVNGRPLATYCRNYAAMYAKLNSSGMTWGSEETAYSTYGMDYGYTFSLGSDSSGNVYVFLINWTPYDYIALKRTQSTGAWSTMATLDTTGDYIYHAIGISVLPNGDLYCFIANKPTANYIQYKRYISSSWDGSWTDWEAGTSINNYTNLQVIQTASSSKIAVFWIDQNPTNNLMVSTIDLSETTVNVYINYGIFRY